MPVVAVSMIWESVKENSNNLHVNGSGAYLDTGNYVTLGITVAPLTTTSYTVTVSDAIDVPVQLTQQ